MAKQVEKMIAQTFLQMAQGLESGNFGTLPKVAVTSLGSELGEANVFEGALMAAKRGVDVTVIGKMKDDSVTTVEVADEDESHKTMENLLTSGQVDACVTMHYPFPIGVSTVGRVQTPGRGREIFIATTTGTSSSERVEGMIKNAIYGVIAAKACGIKEPTVGILNIDGARQTEGALKQLQKSGYGIKLAESERADGGCIFRGNDVLTGSADVLVTDPLTGNAIIKMLASFTTGGSYESVGFGYGPGIGEGYDRLVMIISRASGAPVVAGAIEYAAELVKGDWKKVAADEFAAANKAGLKQLLNERKKAAEAAAGPKEEAVVAPPKEVVTGQIAGIEIMDLEDAVQNLWKNGVYAESGMGCTGPIVMVAEDKVEQAFAILEKNGFITQ